MDMAHIDPRGWGQETDPGYGEGFEQVLAGYGDPQGHVLRPRVVTLLGGYGEALPLQGAAPRAVAVVTSLPADDGSVVLTPAVPVAPTDAPGAEYVVDLPAAPQGAPALGDGAVATPSESGVKDPPVPADAPAASVAPAPAPAATPGPPAAPVGAAPDTPPPPPAVASPPSDAGSRMPGVSVPVASAPP